LCALTKNKAPTWGFIVGDKNLTFILICSLLGEIKNIKNLKTYTMKKTILLVAMIATTLIAMAQNWKPVPVTPLPITDLTKVRGGYAQLGSKIYISMAGTVGRSTIVSYDTITATYDTLPGGINLPVSRTILAIGPDSTLWVVGSGIGSDSVIYRTHLSDPGPPSLTVLWGPRFRPGTAKYAWIQGVGFLGNSVYFAGRFDSLGTNRWPNLVKYSNQTWSQPAEALLSNIQLSPPSGNIPGVQVVKSSNANELAVVNLTTDTIVVINQSGGYVIPFHAPLMNGTTVYIQKPITFYKGDLYFSAVYQDSVTTDVLFSSLVRIKKGATIPEFVAKIYMNNNTLDFIADLDTVHGYLLAVMSEGGYRDTLSQQTFMPVMAFDSTQWTPVTDLFAQGSVSVFSRVEQGLFFGKSVTTVKGVAGLGFYRFDYEDTTAPVITLNGSDTVIVHKGSVFTDPGATALDNEDGDITSSIVVTGVVDTGTLGTYTITYTVTDAAGNTASITRIVIVDHPNGISNLDNPEMVIKVYSDRFVVSEVTTPATVRVFATTGQQVSEFGIMHQGIFSYTGLARGVYIASVGSKNFRFVVQ
jgi:hypothetical protein